MKLFEHINGNRFKVSEIEKSVVLDNSKVSEPQGFSNDISKEEEHISLQIIRSKLIPKAVKSYNRYADTQQGFLDIPRITDKDVRMTLKKSGRKEVKMRQEPKEVDMIRYIAHVKGNGREKDIPIYFDIVKRPHWLYVEYHHVYDSYAEGTSRRITIYNTERFEGKLHTIKEGEDDFYMTKEEEQNAYVYMVRNVIPIVVRDMYIKFIHNHPQIYPQAKYPEITSRDVVQRIKKQRTDIDSRTYESVINNRVFFTFLIKKKLVELPEKAGKMTVILIGAQGPINTDWKYYEVKH